MIETIDELQPWDTNSITNAFDNQKYQYQCNPYPVYNVRLTRLKRIKFILKHHWYELGEYLYQDFGCRSLHETYIAEVIPCLERLRYIMHHLASWMKPEKRETSLLHLPANNHIIYQPKGIIGIIVPWNYPLMLSLMPLCYALAAGNRVMIKMSELTPFFNHLLRAIFSHYFKEDLIAIIDDSDIKTNRLFSSLPFDHLFFTGSKETGRAVMQQASPNLTPLTLELGGKSPAIVEKKANITQAGNRLCFGKALNAGQTCIAPDHIYCHRKHFKKLIKRLKKAFNKQYPDGIHNGSYTSLISNTQFARLIHMLKEARDSGATLIYLNEEAISYNKRILPLTLVVNPDSNSRLMQEEIFGPILPIFLFDSLDEVITTINNRPRPLALYLFSKNHQCQQYVVHNTHAGGMCINDTLMQFAQNDLPFGGIGDSGMGVSYGKECFFNFSHAKSIHTKGLMNLSKFLYPPYGKWYQKLFFKWFE